MVGNRTIGQGNRRTEKENDDVCCIDCGLATLKTEVEDTAGRSRILMLEVHAYDSGPSQASTSPVGRYVLDVTESFFSSMEEG